MALAGSVMWLDEDICLLVERAQLIYGTDIMAESSSHPGEIVVTKNHRHEGHCLQWKHHHFFLLPSGQLYDPNLYMHMELVWLKNMHYDEGKYRSLILKCDLKNLVNCPVFAALLCAFYNHIFLDYTIVKDVLQPTHPVLEMREICLDPSCLELPILRKVIYVDGLPIMSEGPM
ncbi:hypothetical protein B0H17DRAFT_1217764 [Mycena rosella]|uniref:Uncharacterized protein n=1 Tax=Mycena rosella TaxID=1033263 RepID=A0AAD7FLQ1_MYCRO|nr:hypothetical protein B0H17DRAFT_1217764 [Mycena rosella]